MTTDKKAKHYHALYNDGYCGKCFKNLKFTDKAGREYSSCETCLDKDRVQKQKKRARRARNLRCLDCGRLAVEGLKLCQNHRIANQIKARRGMRRLRRRLRKQAQLQ